MTEGAEYISMCFGLGGDVHLNISGGSINGYNAAYSWSEENMSQGYQGDELGNNAEINISGGIIERFNSFDVTFSNGNTIKLVDYGSSGSNWHRGENKISVFLDK